MDAGYEDGRPQRLGFERLRHNACGNANQMIL
jgi:hypothetical protein